MNFDVKPELRAICRNKFFKTNKSCNAAQRMNVIWHMVDFVWLTCAGTTGISALIAPQHDSFDQCHVQQ